MLAFGLTTFKEHGFGGFVRLRLNYVAFDAAYGVMPIIILYSGARSDVDFDWATVHTSGSVVFFFSNNQKRFQNGLRLGGVYDNVMGPAGMLGWVGDIVWANFALGIGAGLQVYPQFNERAAEHFHVSESSISSSMGALQIYMGLNLFWYAI
jgi:hypothetical protein